MSKEAVEEKSTIPILSRVLAEASSNGLRLADWESSSPGELGGTTKIKAGYPYRKATIGCAECISGRTTVPVLHRKWWSIRETLGRRPVSKQA